MNTTLKSLFAATALFGASSMAFAQDVTLRVHHFMSEKSNLHAKMLVPLAQTLADRSEGRLQLEIYPAMSLGGRPGDLYDQAVDGAVDIILTLPGYTAGRFPQAEVFELPFLMDDTVAGSKAYWDLIESDLQDGTYEETHILTGWVHGRGVIHSRDAITSLAEIQGKELRGASRLVTDLLGELGAVPVGMPLPAIPENLSKGVITGALLPWEIVPSIKGQELVTNHTEFGGANTLYTAIFVLAMNHDAYEDLPDDLRAILDEETGKKLAAFTAQMTIDADAISRQIAVDRGNTFHMISAEDQAAWETAAQPVYTRWVQMAAKEGFDGEAAIANAKALIAANSAQ